MLKINDPISIKYTTGVVHTFQPKLPIEAKIVAEGSALNKLWQEKRIPYAQKELEGEIAYRDKLKRKWFKDRDDRSLQSAERDVTRAEEKIDLLKAGKIGKADFYYLGLTLTNAGKSVCYVEPFANIVNLDEILNWLGITNLDVQTSTERIIELNREVLIEGTRAWTDVEIENGILTGDPAQYNVLPRN